MADFFAPFTELPRRDRQALWRAMVGEPTRTRASSSMLSWLRQIAAMGGSVTIHFGPGTMMRRGPWWDPWSVGSGLAPGGSAPPPGGGWPGGPGSGLDAQTT